MPRRSAFPFTIQALALMTAAGALLAFTLGLAGVFAPEFDLIAQFTAHWLVIAVIATVACFATRYTLILLASAIPIACALPWFLAHQYATPTPPPAVTRLAGLASTTTARVSTTDPSRPRQSQQRLRVLTYNSLNLNPDIDAVSREIKRADADVLALIEFGPNKRALIPQLEKIYPHQTNCSDDWNCALAVFSKHPIRRFVRVGVRDDAGPPLIRPDFDFAGRSVTLIAAHILSPNHGPRANYVELDHLAKRVARIERPVIVAGDLNTTIWANAFDNFR